MKLSLLLGCFLIVNFEAAAQQLAEPTRIVIECEDMAGVNQQKFGPGKGWQVGRWGQDLYQNMIYGGVWASRLRVAMTDANDGSEEAFADIEVSAEGTYMVWAKYEAPPFFNYAFGLRIQPIEQSGPAVFDRVYGLLESPKHFCFTDKLTRGSLYWPWGIDHDAAEGYPTKLKRGRYRVTMRKTVNPMPAGARSIDAILITSDLSSISSPRFPRYPMLDELRRANHVYFRFRNLSSKPAKFFWNHWNHRYPDFYAPNYRERVTFFDDLGKSLGNNAQGDWPGLVGPAQASVWYDLGPTMNTESSSPFEVRAVTEGGQATDPSLPLAVDIALIPDSRRILKSLTLGKGEGELTFLVQPDLQKAEGLASTQKLSTIYRDITNKLNAQRRLGPIPKKLKIFAMTSGPSNSRGKSWDFDIAQEFRLALGLNTLAVPLDKNYVEDVKKWWAPHGGIIARSLTYLHSLDTVAVAALVAKADLQSNFYFLSYGDEIGLPVLESGPDQITEFRNYLKDQSMSPKDLGLTGWDQVKLMPPFSGPIPSALKRLYWLSLRYSVKCYLADLKAKTLLVKGALGEQAQTTANLGSMHPFYWMQQATFIEAFKEQAMSLAWSEDYTFCQPEASSLVVDFEASYLRKGASYHDTPMMFYCMPHCPGTTPGRLLQNAVLLWGQNVKDIDFFSASPDTWATENYITYRGGLPMFKMLRTISGMAGLIEDDLLPARTDPTGVALVLSESSDVWELEGGKQMDLQAGARASNISQEERKCLWYALRLAGYRVDLVTEEDLKSGLLSKYQAVYLCGHNLEHKAAIALKRWVAEGGVLFATAGAARKDEYDEPLSELDSVLSRSNPTSSHLYEGPIRSKLELLFQKPLDRVAGVGAFCSRESFKALSDTQVIAKYDSDNSPAFVRHKFGQGLAYYTGILPGQAYVKSGLPVAPAGKGGSGKDLSHFEAVDFDASAQDMILKPLHEKNLTPDISVGHRGVVVGRLSSSRSTVVTITNLAEQQDGSLKNLEVVVEGISKLPPRVRSCFFPQGLPYHLTGTQLRITLPQLQSADVIVISR